MDPPCWSAAVPNQLPLGFWEEKGNENEVGARNNGEEPKDPGPAKFLSQDTSDDRAKAGCCASTRIKHEV